MDISFSTLATPDWSWEQIVTNGPAYGYDGVEVRLLRRDTELLKRPEFAADAIAKRLDEMRQHRFQICGLASSVRFDYADAAVRDEQVQIGCGYIELAVKLQARFVRVFGDVLPPLEDAAGRAATMQNIAEGLQRLGEFAEPRGIGVLIETHGDFSSSLLMRELMNKVRSRAVGVLWDTHHPWRFHGESIAETWKNLGEWTRHTHWKDSVAPREHELTAEQRAADEEARSLMSGHRPADYVLFGEGEFPAAECLRLLQQAGYDGWYSYEWEKAWHPEIADPDVALPPFPRSLRRLAGARDSP
jgi:sugar phosphate isomerase/epimerase